MIDRSPQTPRAVGTVDAEALARDVAADLRVVYGDRLRKVIMFGSRARKDAHPESDLDLLVVLDDFDSRRRERHRADDLLFDRLLEDGVVISQLIVREDEYERADRPVLMRVREEGIVVG